MFLLFVRYLHDERQDVLENDKKIFLMTDWGEGFYFIYSYMKIGNEFNIATLLLGFTNSEICLLNIAN